MTDYALAFIHILPLITIDYLVDGEQVWSFMTRHAKIDSTFKLKITLDDFFCLSYTTFLFDLFLEAREEILTKISLVFWEI